MDFRSYDFEPEQLFVSSDIAAEYATITLSKDGSIFAKVDWEAIPIISGRTWTLHPCGKGKFYARNERFNGERVRIYMHRLLARHFIGDPPKPGMAVDHIDGDGLNNRWRNFRWLDPFENRWRYARHKQ